MVDQPSVKTLGYYESSLRDEEAEWDATPNRGKTGHEGPGWEGHLRAYAERRAIACSFAE